MRRPEDFPDAHLRVFDRPPLPPREAIRRVYLIGICGKGMGALAELLAEAGYAVEGSDEAAFPPMSTRLAAAGIRIHEGYDPAHLDAAFDGAGPDLVVVGNACGPTHPEAAAARERRLVQASLPEALAHLVLDGRRPVVVAGTHGKTTTTGMVAHVLAEAGLAPGVLVGGVMADGRTAALGAGRHVVVEGDEYDSAYFDKRPKMWLYRPQVLVVTSLEFDHADIYDDWDDYRAAFRHVVSLVPPDTGRIVLNADDPAVAALAADARAPVTWYGDAGEVRAEDVEVAEGGQRFTLVADGRRVPVTFPMGGAHNRANALAAAAVALGEGVAPEAVAAALASFGGMARRQQPLGEAGGPPGGPGVLVVDDFAHHPTAVAATLAAVRERWTTRFGASGRLVAVFEPRSNSSRRRLFETPYGEAFDAADRVFLSAPPLRHNDDPRDFLRPERVADAIASRGTPAAAYPSADALLPDLVAALAPGDVVLVMSNGSFDGLPHRLLDALRGEGTSASPSPAGAP